MPSLPPGSPPPERPKPPEGRRLIDYLSPAVLASLTPQAREAMSRVRVSDLMTPGGYMNEFMGEQPPYGELNRLTGSVYLNPVARIDPSIQSETALHEGLHAIHGRPPEFREVYNRSPELRSQFENIYGRTQDYAVGPIATAMENVRRAIQGPEEAFAAFGQRMERGEVPPWQVRWLYREIFTPDALRGPRTRVAGQLGARDIRRRNEERGYAIPLPANTMTPRPPVAPGYAPWPNMRDFTITRSDVPVLSNFGRQKTTTKQVMR